MASLSNVKGRRVIQFDDPVGKRRTLSLGQIERRIAETIKSHVEHIVSATIAKAAMPRATAQWLSEIGDALHVRLAKVGLVQSREERATTELEAFLTAYIKGRTDLKQSTLDNLSQCRRYMVRHFGAKRDISTITRGEAGDWHRYVKGKVSQATVAMHVKKARQMFRDAVDRNLIVENPFAGIKAGSMKNDARQQHVPVQDIYAVIDKCPDSEWRLIFALSRFGGLRTPSETNALTWGNVDWERGRMKVVSPKTAHHEGKGERQVPLYPELLPYLREAFEQAEPGTKHVIQQHRGENLRTTAEKIVARSGVKAWPKIFQNLRMSRQTDLMAKHPIHVVCAWMGNTEAVAVKHYLTVTEDDFKRAAPSAAEGAGKDRKSPGPFAEIAAISRRNPPSSTFPVGVESSRHFGGDCSRSDSALHPALHLRVLKPTRKGVPLRMPIPSRPSSA